MGISNRTGGRAGGTPTERGRDVGEAARTGPVRGYIKLSNAARAFKFDFRGKTVLDIGSSTGGFTKYALDHGAKKVIAVEKGSHQMKAPLCFDPRIELHEKTDIFSVRTAVGFPEGLLQEVASNWANDRYGRNLTEHSKGDATEGKYIAGPAPDVIVADVSFLSLTKILKYAKLNLARSDTDFIVMLKPQFEAKPSQLKDGVVKNETIRRQIIKDFEYWLKSNGFIVKAKHDNSLRGRTGNIERFYHLKLAK